jgi:hypothetical protein
VAKTIKPPTKPLKRRVLFEKAGLCPDLEQMFYNLLSAAKVEYDIRFPYSDMYIVNSCVVFEHDYARRIFKCNTEMFWNQCMDYFGDYEKVQKFSNRLISKYLGIKDCEPKPLRSIFVLQLNEELWHTANPNKIRNY